MGGKEDLLQLLILETKLHSKITLKALTLLLLEQRYFCKEVFIDCFKMLLP